MQYVILQNARGFVGESFYAFTPQTSTFADGEVSVKLDGFDFNDKKPIVLVTSLFGSSNSLIELFFTIDVLSRNTSRPIHLLLTYFAYARQDREISPTAPISASVVAKMISSLPITTVSILDLHSPQIQGFFTKPCFNISIREYFVARQKEIMEKNPEWLPNLIVVAPDVGAAKNSRQIANALGVELAIVEKFRYGPGDSEVMGVVGNVKGKNCLIFDDIIDSAGTLCNAAEMLKKQGAKSVQAFATHGIFSGEAQERIKNSALEKVFISKSISHELTTSKIQCLDVWEFIKPEFEKRVENF